MLPAVSALSLSLLLARRTREEDGAVNRAEDDVEGCSPRPPCDMLY